jgi:hypothetical protein
MSANVLYGPIGAVSRSGDIPVEQLRGHPPLMYLSAMLLGLVG